MAAISRYDIHKNQKSIVEAFKLLKKNLSNKINPLLILVGNFATDDPEGAQMYETVRGWVDGIPDVHVWVNVKNNDQVVGSLMALAR